MKQTVHILFNSQVNLQAKWEVVFAEIARGFCSAMMEKCICQSAILQDTQSSVKLITSTKTDWEKIINRNHNVCFILVQCIYFATLHVISLLK